MEGTSGWGRHYPKAKVVSMMTKAKQTINDMREAEIAAREHRSTDPLERAKHALRRSGVAVFSHSLHCQGSTLIVVGQRTMTEDDVIAYAERFGRW